MVRIGEVLMACVTMAAYGHAPAPPRFEVASIKPSANPSSGSSGSKSGQGRLNMFNVTLKRCIMGAFGVGPNRIAGGPAWIDSARYDIVAKADRPVDDDVLMPMLQSLLAERFKLVFHRESRSIQSFVLEVAKGGPKLEHAAADGRATTQSGRAVIHATAITMDRFAEVLSRQMDLPVTNRTALTGAFNLNLEWSPESAQPARVGADSAATPTRAFDFYGHPGAAWIAPASAEVAG